MWMGWHVLPADHLHGAFALCRGADCQAPDANALQMAHCEDKGELCVEAEGSG